MKNQQSVIVRAVSAIPCSLWGHPGARYVKAHSVIARSPCPVRSPEHLPLLRGSLKLVRMAARSGSKAPVSCSGTLRSMIAVASDTDWSPAVQPAASRQCYRTSGILLPLSGHSVLPLPRAATGPPPPACQHRGVSSEYVGLRGRGAFHLLC